MPETTPPSPHPVREWFTHISSLMFQSFKEGLKDSPRVALAVFALALGGNAIYHNGEANQAHSELLVTPSSDPNHALLASTIERDHEHAHRDLEHAIEIGAVAMVVSGFTTGIRKAKIKNS